MENFHCKFIHGIATHICSLSVSVVLLTATVSELLNWSTGYEKNEQTNHQQKKLVAMYVLFTYRLRDHACSCISQVPAYCLRIYGSQYYVYNATAELLKIFF